MHLTPNMYKIVTLKANAKEIITVKCVWHHICTKLLLWRQILRKSLLENACGTIYVQNHYFEGKCWGNHYLKMHLTPHMYKNITLKANATEIVTWKCIWHQIHTKLLLWAKCSGNCHLKMHLTPHMYKIITLNANAKKIITWKCMWHHICAKPVTMQANAKEIVTWKCISHQICTKTLLWRQMLRKSLLENAFDTKYVQNCYFKGKR